MFAFSALVALAATVLIAVAGVAFGSSSVNAADVAAYLTGGDVSPVARNIIETIRLPRVVAALVAGAALAEAGALIQAALDNPLASPNVIGVNAGSGFAVLLAASLFPHATQLSPVAAFAGALAVTLAVFAVAAAGRASKLTVVLAGMAFTAIFTAGMNTILIVNPDAYIGASGFLAGGLSGVKASELALPTALAAAGIAVGLAQARGLNILSLGDAQAASLGVSVSRTRLAALATAAALAGAAVSFAGLLGFVGLVVPHVVRFAVGSDNRRVLALCPIVGAALVCLADLVARTAFAPYEIPVGIALSLLGGPFFVYLILRNRKAI